MMFQALWIIGKRVLEGFCMKHFGERPYFVETTGRCGNAIIWMRYKQTLDDGYRDCYLIFMPHHMGNYTYSQIQDKALETYEQIGADRTTVKV